MSASFPIARSALSREAGNALVGEVQQPRALTELEHYQILEKWNQTARDYPRDHCIHQLIERQAEHNPQAIAVEQADARLTYQELNDRSNQLAHILIRMGVRCESHVAIFLQRSPEMALALLATLKAGAACVPLDPQYPLERLALMLQEASPAVILTTRKLSSKLPRTDGVISFLPELDLESETKHNPSTEVTAENLAHIIFTSGSTGTPRGVLLTHRGMVNHHIAAIELYGLRSTDRVLQFSSPSFDIALEEMFPTWITGGTVVLRQPDIPLGGEGFQEWLQQKSITVLDLPTAYWHELVHELNERKQKLPATLRVVIVGGEKASLAAFALWEKLAKGQVRWINTYGPTEASIIATAYEPPIGQPAGGTLTVLPIGRPIANTQIYLLDEQLNPVPVGESGELHIGGDCLARGYLNHPEATKKKFIPNPFSSNPESRLYKTGDLARYLPSGDIEFVGRTDYQVKILGFRVEPGEIESVLIQHPGITDAIVLASEAPNGDKSLIAYFVSTLQRPPTHESLRKFLRKRLPEHMVPAAFVGLPSFPLTANGKVDRHALPRPEEFDLSHSAPGPCDETERQLLEIWRNVLNNQGLGICDNFFDMGGHSLLALRLMRRIEFKLGRQLPITTLLEHPTVKEFASFVKRGERTIWSYLVGLNPRGTRAPFFCVHGIGGAVLRFRSLANHLGPDQPFYGLQAAGLDRKSPCLNRVCQMADAYLRELRQFQPEGPYYLGGYSLGGAIALEMARRLLQQGEQVGLLVLLDTFPGKFERQSDLMVKFLALPARKKLYHVVRKAREFPVSLKRKFASRSLPDSIKAVQRACYEAALNYVPTSYPGHVTLFHATEKSLSSAEDPRAAWRGIAAGGLETYSVPGDHGSIVDEPQVRWLAQQLKTCLERAQSLVPELQTSIISRTNFSSDSVIHSGESMSSEN